jgi:hypothetical protein
MESTNVYKENRVRRTLAWSASAVLIAIVASYLSLIPTVDAAIDTLGAAGRILVGIVLALFLMAALTCWTAAVRHALLLGRRGLAIGLLVTNFVGGFFYYFLYVAWRPGLAVRPQGKTSARRSSVRDSAR